VVRERDRIDSLRTRQQIEKTHLKEISMTGSILEFFNLATEQPELAKELVELAAKHDFEFTSDELSDVELDAVAGGGDDAQLANIDLQNMLQKQQQTVQMLSNVSKVLRDTSLAVIRKIG
jgi:hypothetical protein